MGSDVVNGATSPGARRRRIRRAQSDCMGMLCFSFATFFSVWVAAAQPAIEPAPDISLPALTARIEALEKLAAGVLPEIAIDGLLNVSLDDDSSMVERDAQARLEHRRLVVALNQAERTQSKSEAELQQMRDQVLALELERKVLALPIEVRERLVQESDQDAAPASAPQASLPVPVQTTKSVVAPVDIPDTQASHTVQQPVAQAGEGEPWFSRWMLLILVPLTLIAVFACKDVAASLIGYFVLSVQHPFDVSHRVEIGGVEGKVTEMGLLCVHMLSPQLRTITIPNREFLSKRFIASPPSAILTPFHVDFYFRPNEDLHRAKRIIRAAIRSTAGADPIEERSHILVSQVSVDHEIMVRLRAKVSVMGTRPAQEVASDLSERVLEHLRGDAGALESELPEKFEPSASAAQVSDAGTTGPS